MSSGHLKRLVAPRSWNIARKERTWTTKPMPESTLWKVHYLSQRF